MKKTSIRWLSFLMVLVMCFLLVIPAAAVETDTETGAESTETAADTEEIDGSLQVTEAEEAPQVNVIEVPEEEPEQQSDAQPAAEQTQAPDEQIAEEEEPVAEDDASAEPDQDGAASFKVSYYYGDELLREETVESGKTPVNAPTLTGDGKQIAGWTAMNGAAADLSTLAVTADLSLYAWCKPDLESTAHNRYINGSDATTFSPDTALTRAEAAQLLYNLLTTKECGPIETSFSDVTPGKWYYTAVTVLASYGIINGYSDGAGGYTFKPNQKISRAEFVTIVVRLTGVTGGTADFSDVPTSSWAYSYIAAAAGKGWVNGYESGKFLPDNSMARCEAVTVLNRVLGRTPDKTAIDAAASSNTFTDVKTTHWAYYNIMEAYITHTYTTASGTEVWTSGGEEEYVEGSGLTKIDGVTYYITDNKKTRLVAGINKVAEGFVYAAADGYAVTAEMITVPNTVTFTDGTTASKALEDTFNTIGSTLFYWDTSTQSATYLSAGVNILPYSATVGYYADKAGYNIRHDFGAGVVTLNGKLYISDGYCGIYVKGEGYSSATSALTTVSLAGHLFEYKNGTDKSAMYYVQNDYSLLQNGWYTHLYFGSDGKYTTTDAELDTYVDNVILNYVGIDNNTTSQVDKLLKAYYYLRGGSGNTWTSNGFTYRQLSHGYISQRANGQYMYSWQIDAAKYFFANSCGMCYEWCSAYLFLARRLGFDAYSIVGFVFTKQTRHNWCMIKWNGTWHLSDVELEWGYIAGWYSKNNHIYWNLFDMEVGSEYFSNYVYPKYTEIVYYYTEGV